MRGPCAEFTLRSSRNKLCSRNAARRSFRASSNDDTGRIYDLRFAIYELKVELRVPHHCNPRRREGPTPFDHISGHRAVVVNDGFVEVFKFVWTGQDNEVRKGVFGEFASFTRQAKGARAIDGGHA